MRWYLGHVSGKTEPFRAASTPTTESHGHLYNGVTGPFRTKRGCQFMHVFGRNNPHCLTVSDAERLAKEYVNGKGR